MCRRKILPPRDVDVADVVDVVDVAGRQSFEAMIQFYQNQAIMARQKDE